MFIETEVTPNPAVIKFIPGKPVMGDLAPLEFFSADEAREKSQLAYELIEIEGVRSVFFGSDFVSVTKGADVEWFVLKPPILGAIMEFFLSGQPLFQASADGGSTPGDSGVALDDDGQFNEDDREIVNKIKELLETRIRPAVARDGGDIVFKGFDKGVVFLSMRGACAGCPSSTMTLKMGIENMLRHFLPDVLEVRAT